MPLMSINCHSFTNAIANKNPQQSVEPTLSQKTCADDKMN